MTTTTGGEWNSAREARDLSASGSSRKVANVSTVPSLEKPLLILPKKDKAPVLPSSLPNESALVIDSEDDYGTFHDAETIPDKAHAPMPLRPLSPRRKRVSNSNSGSTRALVASGTTQTTAAIAQSSLFAHTVRGFHLHLRLECQYSVPFVLIATDC